jgi:hypothetical protein
MFSSSNEKDLNENKINWNELTDLGQLNEIIAMMKKPVAIFKHSTRCSDDWQFEMSLIALIKLHLIFRFNRI